MLAAIFSSYGNGTRQDRFIPVSTALLEKKTARRHACMHVHAGQVPSSIVGVESITYAASLVYLLSSSVVAAFFVV